MAFIFTLSEHQIEKAQKAINKYIMDKTEAKRNWLSREKIYQPIKKVPACNQNKLDAQVYFTKIQ